MSTCFKWSILNFICFLIDLFLLLSLLIPFAAFLELAFSLMRFILCYFVWPNPFTSSMNNVNSYVSSLKTIISVNVTNLCLSPAPASTFRDVSDMWVTWPWLHIPLSRWRTCTAFNGQEQETPQPQLIGQGWASDPTGPIRFFSPWSSDVEKVTPVSVC